MSNISRSKDNQTMKFGQLIVYNIRKNHTQNVEEKLFPDAFLKNQNWAYLRINSLKFYTVFFFNVCQVEDYLKILKLNRRTLAFTSYEAFLKTKWGLRELELVSLPHFMHGFWKKYFSCYILLTDEISLSNRLYFTRYWAICVL